VGLLVDLSAAGITMAAHDPAVGGLGVALARMAIEAGCGADVELPAREATLPTAALFGERVGRAVVAVRQRDEDRLVEACALAGVPAMRLGAAGGDQLRIGLPGANLDLALSSLLAAWTTPF
jgi:phosphoribosylformylglycinamidine synthase subunit PurL